MQFIYVCIHVHVAGPWDKASVWGCVHAWGCVHVCMCMTDEHMMQHVCGDKFNQSRKVRGNRDRNREPLTTAAHSVLITYFRLWAPDSLTEDPALSSGGNCGRWYTELYHQSVPIRSFPDRDCFMLWFTFVLKMETEPLYFFDGASPSEPHTSELNGEYFICVSIDCSVPCVDNK